MATERSRPEGQAEITTPKIFQNSWLDSDIQRNLVEAITHNTLRATMSTKYINNLYVVTFRRFYEGSVNVPFDIVEEKYKHAFRDLAEVSGPFQPIQACAFAYLEQEAPILIAASPKDEIMKTYKSQGVFSLKALGQGVSILSSHTMSWKKANSSWPMEKVVQEMSKKSRPVFESEIVDYHKRYEDGKESYGYNESSTAFFEWKAAENRLRGFDQGKLLLQELLKYPWEI